MPGCITHNIFAKDCFDKLDNNNLKNIYKAVAVQIFLNIAIIFLIYSLKI